MIEIKGYFLDLLRVWNEIEDPNKKNNLTSLEYNIIKELLGLLKDPDFYYIPQHVEDYEYPRNNLNTFVFHETFVIESDIESYELVSKNIRMKTYTPTIYLYIKEKHRNFENLSLITNNKIKDNILYGKPNATDQEIENASKQANAFEFISSFLSFWNSTPQ